MTEAELDAALAALTAVEADPALADRVVRAIERGELGPAVHAPWRPLVAAAASLLVLTTGLVGWRIVQPGGAPAAPPPPPTVIANAADAKQAAEVPFVVAARERAVRPPERREAPWPSRLASLEPAAPIAIERIEHGPSAREQPISQERLGIEPLSVAQLEIGNLGR